MSGQLIVGIHAVRTALKHGAQRIDGLWYDAARKDRRLRQLLEEARSTGLRAQPSDKAALFTERADHEDHGQAEEGRVLLLGDPEAVQ